MEIGEPEREIQVEPLEPAEPPVEQPVPSPAEPKREPVPA